MFKTGMCLLLGILLQACLSLSHGSRLAIVGGEDITKEPELAAVTLALAEKGEARPFCSGTWIQDEWLLTAAHCLWDRKPERLTVTRWEAGGLGERRAVLDIVFYAADLNGREFPNFDLALVKFAPFASKPSRFPEIQSNRPFYPREHLILAGFGAEQTSCDATDCRGRGLMVGSELAARIDSSRMFSLLHVKSGEGRGACFGDSGGPAFSRQGETWELVGSTVGVWLDLMPHLRERVGELCESGESLYTDLSAYRDWILATTQGKVWKETPAASRPQANDPVAWCRYVNVRDPAWNTLQQVLAGLAKEDGVDSARLWVDCPYAMGLLKERAGEEISLSRPAVGPERNPLLSLYPLQSLGPMQKLSLYFQHIQQLEVPVGLKAKTLEIVGSQLDQASFCRIVQGVDMETLSVSNIRSEPLDLSCLLSQPKLRRFEFSALTLSDPKQLEALKSHMSVVEDP